MKKITKKQAKEYFDRLTEIENEFFDNVLSLEKTMQRETGIKDIEFFCNDGCYCGIGNARRTMKLMHR